MDQVAAKQPLGPNMWLPFTPGSLLQLMKIMEKKMKMKMMTNMMMKVDDNGYIVMIVIQS